MRKTIKETQVWIIAGPCLALATACGAAPVEDGNPVDGSEFVEPEAPTAVDDSTADGEPVPVARLELDNGNTLEFFDMGTSALIMEHGAAGEAPQLDTEPRADQLVATWERFAKGSVAPFKLRALEAKLMNPTQDVGEEQHVAQSPVAMEIAPQPTELVEKANYWCNNVCCDPAYLEGVLGCGDLAGASEQWYLRDYGWSVVNYSKAIYYTGVVCAAAGTSTFRVSVNGKGGTWPVAQGTWKRYTWTAGWKWIGGWQWHNVYTSVNDPPNGPTHTYCGRMIKD